MQGFFIWDRDAKPYLRADMDVVDRTIERLCEYYPDNKRIWETVELIVRDLNRYGLFERHKSDSGDILAPSPKMIHTLAYVLDYISIAFVVPRVRNALERGSIPKLLRVSPKLFERLLKIAIVTINTAVYKSAIDGSTMPPTLTSVSFVKFDKVFRNVRKIAVRDSRGVDVPLDQDTVKGIWIVSGYTYRFIKRNDNRKIKQSLLGYVRVRFSEIMRYAIERNDNVLKRILQHSLDMISTQF